MYLGVNTKQLNIIQQFWELEMAAVSGVDRNANDGQSTSLIATSAKPGEMECKLCLAFYPKDFFYKLELCGCYACEQCMTDYVEAMLNQDRVLQLSCPVNNCAGVYLTTEEVRRLLDEQGFARFQELKYMKEVEVDPTKTFCPQPGCENVCQMLAQPPPELQRKLSSRSPLPIEAWQLRRVATAISCSKCQHEFCSVCKTRWHDGISCEQANAQLKPEDRSVLFISGSGTGTGRRQRGDTASQQSIKSVSTIIESDLPKFIDLINEDSEDEDEMTTKPCPVCALPIERDLGCARIECARCNHNFCWHCLEILDEDFMWMHYETGPCKDRMGVPPGQVHTYRLTAILTMAGIGLLMLVASPVIVIAAPCLLCYKFAPKDKSDEDQQSETSSLQSSSSADRTSRYTRSENEQAARAASTSASASASTRRSPYAEEYCPPKPSESIFSSCRIL